MGTKSVLFGAHQFLIHPWFVAAAWWQLYGFPWAPWLWIAFFVHDIGYIGKPNMDGPEGEEHPWTGARILYAVQAWWLFVTQFAWKRYNRGQRRVPRWALRRRLASAHVQVSQERVIWGNESLFHSRFFAKRYGAQPSRLCIADKLATKLVPKRLYLFLVRATGEVQEYMERSQSRNDTGGKYVGMNLDTDSIDAWYESMIAYMDRWIDEHRDGRPDTWTGSVADVASMERLDVALATGDLSVGISEIGVE